MDIIYEKRAEDLLVCEREEISILKISEYP